jgi:protein TonB
MASDHIMPDVMTPAGLSPADLAFSREGRVWRNVRFAFSAAILLHVGFVGLFIIDELELSSSKPTSEKEISVDLVDEKDVPGSGGGDSKGGEKNQEPGGKQGDASKQGEKQAETPVKESSPFAEPAKKAETAERQPERAPPPQPQGAQNPPPRSEEAPQEAKNQQQGGPVEPPPAPAQGAPPNPEPRPAQPPATETGEGIRPMPRLPTFAMPGIIGMGRAPTPGNALSEDYKGTVYAMLERAKNYPEAARARHASGMVVVTFSIDDAGNPQSVKIARSSGHPDLDQEAQAMVQRAAPYPAPPSGVVRSFAPAITFGLN